jgi:hypothetical protein
MDENNLNAANSTDTWPLSKMLKHIWMPWTRPKDAPKRGKKEIALTVISFVLVFIVVNVFRSGGNSLPSCDSTYTVDLLKQIYSESEYAKNASFISIKNMSEQGFNKESEIRACASDLVTSKGPLSLQYSVKWQDKKAGTFLVEINSAE